MVLSLEQIKEYIKEPQNKDLEFAKELYVKLQVHINGIGTAEYLNHLESFENDKQYQIRKDIALSNKHIFSRLLRPKDKIYSAKGGSITYDVGGSTEKFSDKLRVVRNGQSLYRWLEKQWMPRYDSDPNGLIYIENTKEDAYPTYKAVTTIHDYIAKGLELEYVIFEPEKYIINDKEVYIIRVVDEQFDYTFKKYGDKLTEVTEDIEGTNIKGTKKNIFNKVPARIIGDIEHPIKNYYIPAIWEALELADEYLIDKSIHTIFKKLHGFPLFWRIIEDCPECQGTGKVDYADKKVKCPACKGLKVNLKKDITDMIGVLPPQENETAIVPNVAGYVSPDIGAWSEMRTELDWLYTAMSFAIWDSHTREDGANETATGKFIDQQPVNDKLNKYSDSAEDMHKWCSDILGEYYHQSTYKGSSITYGRRYLLESADAIWNKFLNTRKEGSPFAATFYQIDEYYQTEFQSDSMKYSEMVNLTLIEPYPFNTVDEVMKWTIPEELKMRKVLFQDWVSKLKTEDKTLNKEQLEIKFNEYINNNENSTGKQEV